jgi:ubiquinone/menaquinone biosynthesis C-methylase UbiE
MSNYQIRKISLQSFVFLIAFLLTIWGQSSRDNWQQPQRVLDSLGVQGGMVIGEAGAGDGYFTYHLAARVGGSGRVYANDIDDDELDKIRKKIESDSITNIVTILGESTETNFPDSTMDMVIMVYVFHHLDEPVPFFKNLTRVLKPGAPVIILERDPDKYQGRSGHFYPKKKLISMIQETGYRVDKIYTFLSRDNIYVIYP